jgi:uncharacterized protein YbbC (DUF1343 family)
MIQNGLDHIEDAAQWLKGRRLGLITSVSGVTQQLRPGIEKIHGEFPLTALFGPEHGVRGDHDAGALVGDYNDPDTGLPVYSLYRKDSKRLTPEMLDKVDTVIYDIQDVGSRYYTFISTLLYALQDCAAAKKSLVVLDRLNPLGGKVEGGLLQPGFQSFVGAYPLCCRYGMTAGEFARMANEEQHIGCDLHILPVQGWKRSQLFPETGSIWMMPSLGIPRFETALLYPGLCFVEGTNLSEGRGTSCPFELIGAPYIHGASLAAEMNRAGLPGVIFTAAHFTPTSSKHAGEACDGVHIHISDIQSVEPVRTGLTLLYKTREMYPEQLSILPPAEGRKHPFISLLAGCDAFEGEWPELNTLLAAWAQESTAFAARSRKFYLYE